MSGEDKQVVKGGDLAAEAEFREALVESVEQGRIPIAAAVGESANANARWPGSPQRAPIALRAIKPVPAFPEIGGGEAVQQFAGVDADTR